MGFRLELQDSTGAKIEPLRDGQGNVILDGDGDPILPVRVGDQFRVQVFVDDLRPTSAPTAAYSRPRWTSATTILPCSR